MIYHGVKEIMLTEIYIEVRTCDILEFYSLTARPFKYTVDLEEIHKLGFSLFAST